MSEDRLCSDRGARGFAAAAIRRMYEAIGDVPGTQVLTTERAARLQCMPLPDGRFLLVLDGWPQPSTAQEAKQQRARVAAAVPDACVLISSERIEIPQAEQWDDHWADEACAMTGPGDEELIGQLRKMWGQQAEDAEAWLLRGRQAVDELDTMRVARDRAEEEESRWRHLARRLVQVGPVPEVKTVDELATADAELREALTKRVALLERVVADVRETQAAAPRTRVRDLRLGPV